MIDSADGELTSFSSIDDPDGNQRPAATYFFTSLVVGRVVLLHHAVAVGAAEVEDVVRVLLDQREVLAHRLREVLPDRRRVVPAPLGVEVRVADDVQRRVLREVGCGRLSGLACHGRRLRGPALAGGLRCLAALSLGHDEHDQPHRDQTGKTQMISSHGSPCI